jgi:hypothetical protein
VDPTVSDKISVWGDIDCFTNRFWNNFRERLLISDYPENLIIIVENSQYIFENPDFHASICPVGLSTFYYVLTLGIFEEKISLEV